MIEFLKNIPVLQTHDKTFARGEIISEAGVTEKHLFYVKSGAVHAFYVAEREEHTIRFGYKGSMITSIPSFYDQSPSLVYLQAIRKTVVTVFERKSFYAALEENEELKALYVETLENLAAQQMEREIDLLTGSPADRLNRVMKRSPQLFQEVPMKYIASYLRMTPETLSRIMNS
ncbi:MAG: Crp/Fnr family transcriptional regulator [Salibacteraceae bacterium]